jgi:hypothetical protein
VTTYARALTKHFLPYDVSEEDRQDGAADAGAQDERPWWLPGLPSGLRPVEWALEHMWDGPNLAYAYFLYVN